MKMCMSVMQVRCQRKFTGKRRFQTFVSVGLSNIEMSFCGTNRKKKKRHRLFRGIRELRQFCPFPRHFPSSFKMHRQQGKRRGSHAVDAPRLTERPRANAFELLDQFIG